MNKRIFKYIGILLAIAILWSIPLVARKTVKSSLPSYHSEEPEKLGYTLREHAGKIGVFKNGETLPISVLEVDIRTLPESERVALAHGIHVTSEEELSKRIEDYSS